MKKTLATILACVVLSGCVSEPLDPAFIGEGAIDKQEAAKTRVSLGLTYLENGNFSQAKVNLDKALEFAPRSGDTNYAMAYYFQQVDEIELAGKFYKKALSFSKNDPDIVNSYGAFLCGQGHYEEAKDYFLKAVNSRNYSATAETFENMAICATSQEKIEESVQYLNSALNHQPTRASSLLLLAQANVALGEFEKAKRSLVRFERNAPVSVESLYLHYRIAKGLQDAKEVIGYADLLVKMHPEHPYTKEAISHMGKFKPTIKVTRKLGASSDTQTPPIEVEAPSNTVTDSRDNSKKVVDELSDKNQQTNESLMASDVKQSEDESTANNTKRLDEVSSATSSVDVEADGYHVVQPKENLYRISLKYNVKMRRLLEWNNLDDASSITIGTKLRVKEPTANDNN